jgi:hypothetical protein
MKILICMAFIAGVSSAAQAQADSVRIKATIGDKTTVYQLLMDSKEYILKTSSNKSGVQTFSIGKNNYDFIFSSAQEVIRIAKKEKPQSSDAQCYRNLAEVVVNQEGVQGARVCLLDGSQQGKSLLSLLNIIAMTTN